MIIGVDLQTLETPETQRGIGRCARGLVENLARLCPQHRIVGFGFSDRPLQQMACAHLPNFEYRRFALPHSREDYLAYGVLAPFGWLPQLRDLDLCLLTSPLMLDILLPDGAPFPIGALIHDLIPLLYRQSNPAQMTDPQWSLYDARLDLIKQYDFCLSVSETVRADIVDRLGIAPERICAVGNGIGDEFFQRLPDSVLQRAREQLGINRPYVLSVTGHHYRKNWMGVFESFVRLPVADRNNHQLVVVCSLDTRARGEFLHAVEHYGIASQTVLTGVVDDQSLVALYQDASALLFPSYSEGFGIPLIEAMAAGVPIVASDIPVFREVAGQAARFADPRRTDLLAQQLHTVLGDADLRQTLIDEGRRRVEFYRWPRLADRAVTFLAQITTKRAPGVLAAKSHSHPDSERVAYFTLLPPQVSGIADYNESLVRELAKHVRLELFLDDIEPSHPTIRDEIPWHTSRDFWRFHRAEPYDLIVYHIGNNELHGRQYRMATTFPGIVFLHDYSLRFFPPLFNRQFSPLETRDAIAQHYGLTFPQDLAPEHIFSQLSLLEHPLNEKLIETSMGLLVHSQWNRNLIRRWFPDKPVEVLPFGVDADPRQTRPDPNQVRRRYNIPPSAFVVLCAGNLTQTKRLTQTLHAFSALSDELPDALLCLVGQATDPQYFARLNQLVRELNLSGLVRFLGYVNRDELYDVLDMSDVCLNLRYPTLGETSAILLRMMQMGKPTIISGVGQFLEFPDAVCWKVDVGGAEKMQLVHYLRLLARSPQLRSALGGNAQRFVKDWTWEKVAPLHVEAWRRIAAQSMYREFSQKD